MILEEPIVQRNLEVHAEFLQMAVFSVNATIEPEGLCPILLVFGAIPRPARASSTQTQLERAKCIEHAMAEVEQDQARRRIEFIMTHMDTPKGKKNYASLDELPEGSKVMVYRTKSKSWEGPQTFLSKEGETVVIQTKMVRKIFRSLCGKLVVKEDWNGE